MPQTNSANGAKSDGWKIVLWLFALLNLANGLWMLADPSGWYSGIPAAVPDTGPLNEHFVRDIGATFVTLGLALYWAGLRPAFRAPLVGVVALFLSLHALVHVYDTLRGLLPTSHWLIDFPAVYLPTGILIAIFFFFAQGSAESRFKT